MNSRGIFAKSVNELKELESNVNFGEGKVMELVNDHAHYLPNRELSEDTVEEMKEMMKEFISLSQDVNLYMSAISEMMDDEVNEDYKEILQEKLHCIKERNQSEKPEDHEKFKQLIHHIEHAKNKERNSAQVVEDSEGNLVVFGANLNKIDPISKQRIQTAVKSRICRHSYDKTTILNHIKRKRGPAKCPVSGCSSYVREEDLEDDYELQRYLDTNTPLPENEEDDDDDD